MDFGDEPVNCYDRDRVDVFIVFAAASFVRFVLFGGIILKVIGKADLIEMKEKAELPTAAALRDLKSLNCETRPNLHRNR